VLERDKRREVIAILHCADGKRKPLYKQQRKRSFDVFLNQFMICSLPLLNKSGDNQAATAAAVKKKGGGGSVSSSRVTNYARRIFTKCFSVIFALMRQYNFNFLIYYLSFSLSVTLLFSDL
jgi:hypothetical protein